jgi:hypothetical protein
MSAALAIPLIIDGVSPELVELSGRFILLSALFVRSSAPASS